MGRYEPKLAPRDPCPVEHVLELVGGKWKPRILAKLKEGDAPMGELGRLLPRARPQVLAAQLRELESDGIVGRLAPAAGETWGRFRLTERGRGLCEVLDVVAAWGGADLSVAGARSESLLRSSGLG